MDQKSMRVTFCGGVGSVTGANFLLETDTVKILVDCGLLQGANDADLENQKPFPYDPTQIDFLLVTHAHMDHIGKIPKLVKDGFKGIIYSTPETKSIAELMLEDAVHLMDYDARQEGILPLYGALDVKKAFTLWKEIPYHEKKELLGGVEVYLKDAGHILGSSMIECTYRGKKIVFTGDLGNSPSALLRDTEAVTDADYIVMDSVYGDRNHESKEERERRFEQIVKDTIAKGGALVIPAFSLERTQVILHELNDLVEKKKITSVPVFLDSPLAIKVTQIYEKISAYYNDAVKKELKSDDDIFKFPRLKATARSEDSQAIDAIPNPKIIIAGSGMSAGGRIIHHEINYLPDPKSTILLMGYQAVGTLGRQIEEGTKTLTIQGTEVPVRARIEMISGYSAHKDSDHLIEFVAEAREKVKKVFVTMGEPKSSLFLVQRLRDYLGVDAVYPEKGKVYELDV